MLAVLSFGSQALVPGAVHPHRMAGQSRASTIRCADESFDYLVIGGGSGGIASGRRAAAHGAKVAVIEKARLGGTCVNVGCVPKKVMFNAATILEMIHQAAGYGYTVGETSFSLPELKKRRDAYVARLNGIYKNNLANSDVELIVGDAKFVGPKTVAVGDKTYTGKNILIAVGGTPTLPDVPGVELGITSDGFFDLEQVPEEWALTLALALALALALTLALSVACHRGAGAQEVRGGGLGLHRRRAGGDPQRARQRGRPDHPRRAAPARHGDQG